MKRRHGLDVIGVPPASSRAVRWGARAPHSRTVARASPAVPWPGQSGSWQYRPFDRSSHSSAVWRFRGAASPAGPGWVRLANAAPAGTGGPHLWEPREHGPEALPQKPPKNHTSEPNPPTALPTFLGPTG